MLEDSTDGATDRLVLTLGDWLDDTLDEELGKTTRLLDAERDELVGLADEEDWADDWLATELDELVAPPPDGV